MTAPAIDTTTVDLPEFSPECNATIHVGDRPADWWCDAHGCMEMLLCEPCRARLAASWDKRAVRGKKVSCAHCGREASRWSDLVKAVPLR